MTYRLVSLCNHCNQEIIWFKEESLYSEGHFDTKPPQGCLRCSNNDWRLIIYDILKEEEQP
jgi:hypothetical protein